MARRKKLENTSLEEQLEYVEQEIRTKESDLKELRHKAKEIQKEIEEKQKDELFKALVASGKTINSILMKTGKFTSKMVIQRKSRIVLIISRHETIGIFSFPSSKKMN